MGIEIQTAFLLAAVLCSTLLCCVFNWLIVGAARIANCGHGDHGTQPEKIGSFMALFPLNCKALLIDLFSELQVKVLFGYWLVFE